MNNMNDRLSGATVNPTSTDPNSNTNPPSAIQPGSTIINDYNIDNNTRSTTIEPPPSTWLTHWNNTSDPTKLSCKDAFDTLMYCFTPANQIRNIYRTGSTDSCATQLYDIHKCLQIKAEAIKSIDTAQLMLYQSYQHRLNDIKDIQHNHIWKYRTEIPKQFRFSVEEENINNQQ